MPARRPTACVLLTALVTGAAHAVAPPERPRLDVYGDHLPRFAVARLGTVRLRHVGFARHLAFSPDGKTLASSCAGNLRSEVPLPSEADLFLWRVSDGAPQGRLPGLWAVVRARDRLLALRSAGEADFLHDMIRGKELGRALKVRSRYFAAISPDGKKGVWAGERMKGRCVFVLDLRSGKILASFNDTMSLCAAFSRDGKTVWSGDLKVQGKELVGRIRQWDLAGRRLLRDLPAGRGAAYQLAVSDDGKTLAVAHATPNYFDDSDEKQTAVTLRDAVTGRELHVLSRHGDRTISLAFSPDGSTVAAGRFRSAGLIQLYDTKTGRELPRVPGPPTQGPSASVWTSAAEIVTLHEDATVRHWASTGKPGRVVDLSRLRPVQMALDASGTHLAWTDKGGGVFTRNLRRGREKVLVGVRHQGGWLTIRSAGKRTLLAGLSDGDGERAWAWDINQKEARWFTPVDPWRHAWLGAFSPDGSRLVLADSDNAYELFDTGTGARILTFEKPPKRPSILLFSPDGLTLAASHDDQTITFWDVTTGKRRPVRLYHPSNLANREAWKRAPRIAISPDGNLLASGGVSPDTTVRLWDVATGKELARLVGHEDAITSLAFSPDGKRLVSGSADSTGLVWDVAAALTGRR